MVKRVAKVAGIAIVALVAAVTVASFGYNLATDGPAPRPVHLLFAEGGGWDTRYLEWGTHGTPVILVPGAFETADTFAKLGPVLANNHRVFAIDLSGTGYSAPDPPFSAGHLAAQILAFARTEKLTGANAPVLVGHSAGAADVGIAALQGPEVVKGVVFLDGDATPLRAPSFLGAIASTLFINPYKTSVLRLALSQDWLIKNIYSSQCGPTCPQLNQAGVNTWRWPLEQPGFQTVVTETMRFGITAMTPAQFAALKAASVPKLVVFGVGDAEMSHSDAALTARRIGAPPPVSVPGRHLTMIASPGQVAAAIDSLGNRQTRRSGVRAGGSTAMPGVVAPSAIWAAPERFEEGGFRLRSHPWLKEVPDLTQHRRGHQQRALGLAQQPHACLMRLIFEIARSQQHASVAQQHLSDRAVLCRSETIL